jgi:predicted phage terminase large subunit-like protein
MIPLTAELIEGFVSSVLVSNFDGPTETPEVHREWWRLCCSDSPLVAIGAPRGHAKSTAITLAYTLAAVLFRNRQFVIIVSDTESQSKDFLGEIKKELQGNDNLISLFRVREFVKDSETDIIVRMEDGYEFRIIAKGSEQKVRGLKWKHKRPDLIVCDDMENDEIVMSPERRLKFRNWVIKALLPCRAPGGIVRVVGTILHLDSFLARICPIEGEKFTKKEPLKLVSINPRSMWKSIIYAAHEGNTPQEITRQDQILWPTRFDKAFFIDKYDIAVDLGSPEGYSQEYLNRPLDEVNALFRRSDFIAMREDEKDSIKSGKKPLQYYCGVDLAISERETADYTVFHVVGIDSENYMYHINTIRERLDGREIVDTLLRLSNLYKLQWVAVGKDKIQRSLGPFLREEMLRSGEFVQVIPVTEHQDKIQRCRSIQARMRIGSVKFDKSAEYYPILEAEFLTFPRGKKDDQVDAYSNIGLALDKMSTAYTYAEQQEQEYYDEIQASQSFIDGRSAITGY